MPGPGPGAATTAAAIENPGPFSVDSEAWRPLAAAGYQSRRQCQCRPGLRPGPVPMARNVKAAAKEGCRCGGSGDGGPGQPPPGFQVPGHWHLRATRRGWQARQCDVGLTRNPARPRRPSRTIGLAAARQRSPGPPDRDRTAAGPAHCMLRPGALPAASLAGPGPGGDCRHGQAGPSPAALNDRMNTEVTFGLRAGGTGGAEGRRAARRLS